MSKIVEQAHERRFDLYQAVRDGLEADAVRKNLYQGAL
jgi:hypothetical protein